MNRTDDWLELQIRHLMTPALAGAICEGSDYAYRKAKEHENSVVDLGQSRQNAGNIYRDHALTRIIAALHAAGGRHIRSDTAGRKVAAHSLPLASDVLELGDILLWFASLRATGVFMNRPSLTVFEIARKAWLGTPLFGDMTKRPFLVLYHDRLGDENRAPRLGIGIADSAFQRIARDLLPDLRTYAAEAARESQNRERTLRHQLELKPLPSQDSANDSGSIDRDDD